MKRSLRVSLVSATLLGGCASAGGTAGIFDSGSVWYKHPTTADVKECGNPSAVCGTVRMTTFVPPSSTTQTACV
jgi:hypothetical protein